jgi:hypothetical protein
MSVTCRMILRLAAVTAASGSTHPAGERASASPASSKPAARPPRLQRGDTVGLIDADDGEMASFENPRERGDTLAQESERIKQVGVSASRGAAIPHIDPQCTVPTRTIGEIEADTGILRLLPPAVV